jgi:hypothetical protein
LVWVPMMSLVMGLMGCSPFTTRAGDFCLIREGAFLSFLFFL